ncbi:MAG: DUF2157 domain-containing protein [Elusimicrobia bacterium]|nr:DUF2157 domain-containing protein [Elusimicrobiota bacterium]
MFSYYKRLKKDLDFCAQEGITNKETADLIYDKIYSRKKNLPEASLIITILGAVLIAAGSILIISHNWNKISDVVKILSYLILYALVGTAAIKAQENSPVKMSAAIIWFFMPIIGFGLYGQIFQISSDPLKPFMAWAIISAPLVWFLEQKKLLFIWEILFYGILFFGFSKSSLFELYSNKPLDIYFIQTFIFYCASFYFLKTAWEKFSSQKCPSRIFAAAMIYLFFFSYSIIRNEKFFFFSLFFAASALFNAWEEELPRFYFIVFSFLSYIFSFKNSFTWSHGYMPDFNSVKTWLAFLACLYSLIYSYYKSVKIRDNPVVYPILALLASALLRTFSLINNFWIVIFHNVFLIWLIISSLSYASKTGNRKLINFGIFLFSLLLISRFIDLFGELGFIKTGIGFIFCGLLLIAASYYLNLWRKKLINETENR